MKACLVENRRNARPVLAKTFALLSRSVGRDPLPDRPSRWACPGRVDTVPQPVGSGGLSYVNDRGDALLCQKPVIGLTVITPVGQQVRRLDPGIGGQGFPQHDGELCCFATVGGGNPELFPVLLCPRNSDGNPNSPQAVVFLTSVVDVTVGY